MMLLSRLIKGLLSQMSRGPLNVNNDDAQYKAFEAHHKYVKDNDTQKEPSFFSAGSTVAVQCKDEGPWTHRVADEANSNDPKGNHT